MYDILTRLNNVRRAWIALVWWCGIIVFLSSCGSANHNFYATDEGNLLALRKEKDLRASAGYTPHGNSWPGSNINAQVGYSPKNHLGVQASYFRNRDAFQDDSEIQQNVFQYNFSGAVGLYHFKPVRFVGIQKLGDEDKEGGFVEGRGLLFDGYLGYSRGRVKNYFVERSAGSILDFQKIYLQGGVHFFLDRVGASIFLRYARMDYVGGEAFGKLSITQHRGLDIIEKSNPFNFLESALKISVGKPTSPLHGYITFAGIYDFGDAFLELQPSTVQLGISADLNYFLSKK